MPNAPDASGVAVRCRKLGFDLSATQAEGLAEYLTLLVTWNRRMNLVGARSWEEALDTLVVDSFWLARFIEELATPGETPETWDLGAGAGLPGIPLRLVWQRGDYWLVEAREKRALFLATVLARLRLPATNVFRGRAEAFMEGRQADIIVSRAFMPWPDVLKLTRPYLAPAGRVILLTRDPVVLDAAPEVGLQTQWTRLGGLEYAVGGTTRYFSAFSTFPGFSGGLPSNAPS